jgi:SAM-dependent methyltransferase
MRPILIRDAERLYDTTADKWVWDTPRMMSDFVACPAILEACRPKAVQGDCLDLGCGEGYFTRMLAHAGARSLVGSDVSTEMIIRAKRMEAQHPFRTLGSWYARRFEPFGGPGQPRCGGRRAVRTGRYYSHQYA